MCWIALLAAFAFADSPANLVLRVRDETAVRGGWVQIQIFATTPARVASGSIHLDLDPAIFGDAAGVGVFSASGDAIGQATVKAGALDAIFQSPWAGIAQLADLPILTVRVPVLANAPLGAATIAIVPSDTPSIFGATPITWTDGNGKPYNVTTSPGTITIQASGLFVQDVQPGGGLVAPGTLVRIAGGGFDASTTAVIDGVAISAANLVSAQEIDVSVVGAIELTGHHVRVSSGSVTVDHYTSLQSLDKPVAAGARATHWIAPFTQSKFSQIGGFDQATRDNGAIFNPNPFPVEVQFVYLGPFSLGAQPALPEITVGAFGIAQVSTELNLQTMKIAATAPVRTAFLQTIFASGSAEMLFPAQATDGTLPAPPNIGAPSPWQWQTGTAAPAPATISAISQFPVAISGAPSWLKVTEGQSANSGLQSFILAPDPGGANLPPGDYKVNLTASVVLPDSESLFSAQSTTFTVELIVFAQPRLVANATNNFLNYAAGGTLPAPFEITLTSTDKSPVPFTTAVASNGNWLSISPATGTTPATLTVSASVSGLAPSTTSYTGTIMIQGPSNTLNIPVFLTIATAAPTLTVSPPSVSFTNEAGASAMNTSFISYTRLSDVTVSVQTQSGGPWLTIHSMTQAGASPSVTIGASSANLAAGVYQGTVTFISASAGTVQVPVTMTVIAAPSTQTRFTIVPTSIELTAQAGLPFPTQTIQITSSDGPHIVNANSTLGSLTVVTAGPNLTTPITFSFNPSTSLPNQTGSIVVKWTGGSFAIPVTLHLAAGPGLVPQLGAIVNAASMTAGSIAPGEIITILGAAIGPAAQDLAIDSTGRVATTLAGAQVLINQIPAPLIYASPEQLSAIVPYEIGSNGFANISISAGGQTTDSWSLPISATSPEIFTLSATGIGPGAILNADNSVNSAANPAARGSTIQVYGTGEGQTSPAGVTGSIIGTDLKRPLAMVSVNIGGADAPVTYAGSAGDSVAGLLQINAIIPQNIAPGDAIPVTVTIGGVASQTGTTVSIR